MKLPQRRRALAAVPPLVAFALALGAWQLVATLDSYLLPNLPSVVGQLTAQPLPYLTNAGTTLAEAMPGLAIGYGVAVLLGVLMSQGRWLMRALLPLAVMLNVTPVLAIAPTLTVALGFGKLPRIVITAVITFFPGLVNTIAGLESAEPEALDLFATLDASRWDRLWRLQLPASLPYLFAGARVAVPLAIVGASVAEMVASATGGLGLLIQQNSNDSHLASAWAGIATLIALGLLASGGVVGLERRVLRWRGFR
jgi:NitT/TauT family transport system permease protein